MSAIATSPHNLDHSLVRSVVWNTLYDWTSQLVSWASFLVVMRLLSPADFGIAAMAALFLPYLQQMTTFGIARAIVTLRDLSEEQLAQLSSVSLLTAVTLFALAVPFSKLFAAFFKTPQLSQVIIVSCLGLIPLGLQVVPCGVLAKELRFHFLSALGAAHALVSAVVTLAMALAGAGYWALVVGNLAGTLLRTILVLRKHPCELAWPRFQTIRSPLKFCWQLVVSTFAFSSYQRLDNLTAGKLLGQSALGLYGSAWALANVPLEKITTLVVTVVPSYLSAVQDRPEELRRYLRNLTETVAIAAFPATVGLGLVAHDLVPLAFGRRWTGMVGPLEVLSYYAAVRSVVAILPKVLTAIGDARYVMWNDLFALILLPIAFYLGGSRGITGIAWAWVLAYPLVALPLYQRTLRAIHMNTGEYLRALWPASEATAAMVIAVQVLKYALRQHAPIVLFPLETLLGTLAYTGVLYLRHKQRVQILIQTVKAAWIRRQHSKGPSDGVVQAGSMQPVVQNP